MTDEKDITNSMRAVPLPNGLSPRLLIQHRRGANSVKMRLLGIPNSGTERVKCNTVRVASAETASGTNIPVTAHTYRVRDFRVKSDVV